MSLLIEAKQLAISVGLYKPTRLLYRVLSPSKRRHFNAHRLLLSQFVKPGDLTFDVGANIGNRTEVLLSLGASVVAFEPQPNCAREIAARGNERLTVIQKAVGETEGTAQLHLKVNNVLASMVPGWQASADVAVLPVQVTTLDIEIEQFGIPSFCKIDVEGFELQVLRGLSSQIRAISLEYHCDEHGIQQVRECLNILSDLGDYRINLIGEEDANFLHSEWLTVPQFIKAFPDWTEGNFWGDLFAVIDA